MRLFILVCSLFLRVTFAFEPISLGIGGGILAGLFYTKETVKDWTYCRFTECCNDDYIIHDVLKLLPSELTKDLYGQHIVQQLLIPALSAHTAKDSKSKKPLVLSFHGTPGTGKNFVSDLIVKSLYKKGLESSFVHKFLGRSDFPISAEVNQYKKIINEKVKEKISKCPRSLFIFDEVDKMPEGIFESITSLLDHHSTLYGNDFSKAIFIFLSNTGGVEISDRLTQLTKQGKWREDTRIHDFEKILEIGSYNLEGGLKETSLIESHLVDHFIPFLPLERKHVRQCLEKEFQKWGKHPTEDDIKEIIDNFIVFDKKTGMYSTSGCKTLEKKVAVHVKSN